MNTEPAPFYPAKDGDHENLSPSHNKYSVAIESISRSLHHRISRNFYQENTKRDTAGPLREGFYLDEDIDKILKDTRTTCITLHDDEKRPISWPLLTPIANHNEYRLDYFDRTPEGRDNTYYLSLPSPRSLQFTVEQEEIGQVLHQHLHNNSLLVYEEYNDEDKGVLIRSYLDQISNTDIVIDNFVDDKNNTAAAAVQFSVPIRFKRDQEAIKTAQELLIPQDTELDTTFIGHNPDNQLINELWDMYQRQFKYLSENFPRQALGTEKQFRTMLQHPAMHTLVRFDEGKPVASATFTTNIEACSWLNAQFYKNTFPGTERPYYFVSIASDPDRRGAIYSVDIIRAFARAMAMTLEDFRIICQCTNISADYIPKIVDRGIRNYADIVEETRVTEFGRYNFRGVRLAPKSPQ